AFPGAVADAARRALVQARAGSPAPRRARQREPGGGDPRSARGGRHARRGGRHDARRVRDPSPRGSAMGGGRGPSHGALTRPAADAAAERLIAALGAERGEEELLDGGALRVVFLKLGALTLELLEPRSPEHTVARFLATRGPGLHHVSLE